MGRILQALTISSCLLASAACFGGMITVSNYTDGQGLFSWTLTKGADPFVWGFDSAHPGHWIHFQAHGLEQTFTPNGWVASNSTQNMVTWRYTNGTCFIDTTPVTFAIQSHFTNSVSYTNRALDSFYPSGDLFAKPYTATNHVEEEGFGTDWFDFIGPRPDTRIDGAAVSADQITFHIEEMAGTTCTVERSTNLIAGVWEDVTNFLVQGFATNWVYDLSQGTNTTEYFRLKMTK